MINLLVGVSLFVSLVLNGVILWGLANLLRQNEGYEELFTQLQAQLITVLTQIRNIDLKGAFESDDEVGLTFIGIKQMIYTLKEFTVLDDDNNTTQETE